MRKGDTLEISYKTWNIGGDCNCLLNPPPKHQDVSYVSSNKISYGSRIVSLESPERGEMNKAEKSLNILPKSMRWAPELLAAHSEFCAEIRQRIGDADQHARVSSGSLPPSDDFEKSGSYWSNFRSVNPTELKLLHRRKKRHLIIYMFLGQFVHY